MVTYLTHPKHGVHIAYSDLEVDDCIKNGWTSRGQNPPDAKKEPAGPFNVNAPEPDRPVIRVKRKYTKRKGH